jgi:glutathione synthase/RimK-type ligase-like ATP-grasp enzyme
VTQTYDVTIVTYERYPDLAPDDRILRDALLRHGASVRTSVWSDPGVDWSRSPVTLIREMWDYPQRYAQFLRWIDNVETKTRLINDPKTVRGNAHKSYIGELERRGFAIVPTIFVRLKDDFDLLAACRRRGWTDVVIKPCVGGSSYGTRRLREREIEGEGGAHLRELLQTGEAMLQPYLPEIEAVGEIACIFIDGALTHAVRKAPFNSSTVTTTEELYELPARDRKFVTGLVAALAPKPLYARVDIVPTQRGARLMELELIEPTLYFGLNPDAAERLARCVLAAVGER